MDVVFFRSPAELRKWFAKHHATARELWVGYYKKGSGRPSITWPESVDEALCVGWIDGVRKSVDGDSYTIRFTPRRPGSIWSAVNIKRAQALAEQGRMQPAGLAVFQARRDDRSAIYSYERRREELEEPYASLLRKNKAAWAFFQSQPPWYKRAVYGWVMSAKKEETRLKRLAQLIEHSAQERIIPPLTRKKPST
jgi:uncharacterized protein YdeI (YjbR/CyaY-like superfamily)